MKKIISLIAITIALFGYQKSHSQSMTYDYPGFNIGVYGGLNFNMHNPDFIYAQQPGVIGLDPVDYTVSDSDMGIGFNAGLVINYPFNEYITLSGRLGYNGMSSVIYNEEIDEAIYIDNGAVSSVTRIEHDVNIDYFEISPMLQLYNLLPVDNLYFLVGPEIGIPINNNLDDNSYIEIDGVRQSTISRYNTQISENPFNYELTDAEIRFALGLGVGYNIEISDNIFLTPEVSYRLAFTDIASDEVDVVGGNTVQLFDSWSANQLRVGVSLTFGFDDEEEIVETESMLDVGFRGVNYLDQSGNKQPVRNIKVEEVQYAELFPLVPYVFFGKNESSLEESNQILNSNARTGEFVIENLPQDVLTVNKSTLDIIGTRMKKYPQSEVTIVGTNDGKEAGGTTLSQKRADYAKAYLVSNYSVNGGKIKTESQNLPDKPSTSRVEEGMAENRRAEFYTKNPNILEPIILESEATMVATPNLIIFSPYANSEDGIKEWNLSITQSGKTLKNINGMGELGDISWSIQPNQIQQKNVPVDYNLTVENSKGVKKMASGSIPVEYLSYQLKQSENKAGKTISKYSLVVFDFDSPNVSDYDKNIIEKYVLPAIKFNSTVQIYGYTDDIGSADYNKKLAGQRADNVKDFISAKNPSAKYEVYAVGEESNIVNNNVPVGRQLSRTVQIYVITPNE